MFNTREQALIVWLIILICYALSIKGVRSSIPDLLRSLLKLMKHPIFFATNMYIVLVFISMYYFEILERGVIKDYVVWILFSLYPLISKVSTKYIEFNFRSIFKGTFKLSIIPIFIINEYTLSIWVELIIVPVLALIGGMLAIADRDEKYHQVKKLLNYMLVVIGSIFIIAAIIGIIKNYKDASNIDFWEKMFFDIIGILLHLPLLFFLRYMCFYEQILIRTNIKERSQKLNALIVIFLKYKFEIDL